MALTLLCLLEWPDGVQRQSYVKIFSKQQGVGIFNEILGYLLSKAENLPVASKAGVLILPDELVKQIKTDVAPVAFVTTRINGSSPSSFYNVGDMINFKVLYNILNDWNKLHEAIAFDEWVANQDRNLGNLIIDSNNAVTLIDHSNMPVDLVWSSAMLDEELEPRNVLAEVFRSSPTLPQKVEILKGAANQSSSLEFIREELSFWARELLNQSESDSLFQFLENRAKKSNERLSKRFGTLAGVA